MVISDFRISFWIHLKSHGLQQSNLDTDEAPKDASQNMIEQDVDSGWSVQKTLAIQEMITNTDEQRRILTTEEPDKVFPQWFKNRALWWVNEEINNKEFISGMEYLFKP